MSEKGVADWEEGKKGREGSSAGRGEIDTHSVSVRSAFCPTMTAGKWSMSCYDWVRR